MLLHLFKQRQLESGRCGLVCGAYPLLFLAGNSWFGIARWSQEAMANVYGVTIGDAAGVEPGA